MSGTVSDKLLSKIICDSFHSDIPVFKPLQTDIYVMVLDIIACGHIVALISDRWVPMSPILISSPQELRHYPIFSDCNFKKLLEVEHQRQQLCHQWDFHLGI